MEESKHVDVCQRTERKEERVKLKNIKNGQIGQTFGCTTEGQTIQVQLADGSLDSWDPADCEEISG